MCTCAPLLAANIDRAKTLGMSILGCCGDENHTSGFHLPSDELRATDYSMVRSGKPDGSYACAGDFGMNVAWARRWLAWLVDSVKAGKYPEVVEIIGSLDGKTVLYWAKWRGWQPREYLGTGHKTWAHVSIDRAKAKAAIDLLKGWPDVPAFVPVSLSKTFVPLFPGRILRLRDPRMRGSDVLRWQKRMRERGWRISADGVFGPQSAKVAKAFQKEKKLLVDGRVGPKTWAAAWTAKIT